jgi:hypothetical protein
VNKQVDQKQPIQPITVDGHGVIRFKENAMVQALLDHGQKHGLGLNELHMMDFSADDRMQLAQLIGYSVSGYGSLSYVTSDNYNAAEAMAEGSDPKDARIETLQAELDAVREALREPMAQLFAIHPDDLDEAKR